MNDKIAKERVARGCAVLDSEMPGWANRIDLSTLDISGCDCVLGQLDAWEALAFSGFAGAAEKAESHGFYVDNLINSDKDYAKLEKHWRKAISERLS